LEEVSKDGSGLSFQIVKMSKWLNSFYVFILIGLMSCVKSPFSPDEWYLRTKLIILQDASRNFDSTNLNINPFSPDMRYYLLKGKAVRSFLKGSKGGFTVVFYSKDCNFELRREVADNGSVLFEGITYKKHFYGLSTWWYVDGELKRQGVRWNDKKVGLWKTWPLDQKNSIVYLFRAGKENMIDSLQRLKVD
jgi:hypothetical protein